MQTIESPADTVEQSSPELNQVRTQTSFSGRYLDIALVVALVGPPAVIGLLMLLGLGFAFAVCLCSLRCSSSPPRRRHWMWKRRMDREAQWDLD